MFFFFPFPGFRSPLFILIFPCTLAAGVYRERLRKQYGMDVSQFGSLRYVAISAHDFDSNLFDCCVGPKAVQMSVFHCFCCPVRLAVNGSATGFMDYWFMLLMSVFFLPLIPIVGYILRLHIREMYGMEGHPCADFFAWLFCYCCALTQETKFLNHGFEAMQRESGVVVVPGRAGVTRPYDLSNLP